MTAKSEPVTVRSATVDDAAAIARIYNEGIRGRGATFETRERSADDIRAWFAEPRFPVLVAIHDGEVAGFAAASAYRTRACYAGVAEYSIYVATSHHGRGVGSALMPVFLDALAAAGFWKVLSRLFPENTASRALCARFGFREVGVYERHAQLDGVWRDVVIVERRLEPAASDDRTADRSQAPRP